MTLGRACYVSVGMHAALLLCIFYGQTQHKLAGLARPPVSDIHARIYTYEASKAATAQEVVDAGLPTDPTSYGNAALKQDKVTASEPKPETIYEQSALDASPVVISNVVLEYPASANNREGVVTLEIVILGSGEVESVRALKATPAGFFEDAAITGFRKAKFSPGMLGSLGVKSRMEIEVEFMPTNRRGGVSGQR